MVFGCVEFVCLVGVVICVFFFGGEENLFWFLVKDLEIFYGLCCIRLLECMCFGFCFLVELLGLWVVVCLLEFFVFFFFYGVCFVCVGLIRSGFNVGLIFDDLILFFNEFWFRCGFWCFLVYFGVFFLWWFRNYWIECLF